MRTLHALSLLLVVALAFVDRALGQTAPATYWVRFTDKAHTPYSVLQPEAFLSPRALQRRAAHGIPVDELDLPVDPAYIQSLLQAGAFQLHTVSKWFNAVTIRSTDMLALDTLDQLPFVAEVRSMSPGSPDRPSPEEKWPAMAPTAKSLYHDSYYGASFRQFSIMNAHLLHERGQARGEGMLIGILDSGFLGADSLPAFAELRQRGGIIRTLDVVCPGCDLYREHWHGRSVLSVMAGVIPGKLRGTAPNADYVLIRTEDTGSEYPVEEDNWIRGAEYADSLGCDVLNTSLGYSTFDDPSMDHAYADLDGATVRISIAAGIASRKGMIPVQSAGNSGSSAWRYITAAADAIDILAVGAVNADRQVAAFSSRGPSADGRVKPDVCAIGAGTIGLGFDGYDIASINGTSFSAPLVCGAVACLWQLHPDKNAQAIMDAVRRSASHAENPDDSLGYGIPDFWRAHLLLGGQDLTSLQAPRFFNVHPVPFSDHFNLEVFAGEATTIRLQLHDAFGRAVLERTIPIEQQVYQRIRIDDHGISGLPNGTYILQATMNGRAEITQRLIKAP